MKLWDIALKDLVHSLRSAFAVGMAFGAPLLMTGLFYLAFGNVSSTGGINLPLTRVQVVNLDAGSPQVSGFSLGTLLVDTLQDKTFSGTLEVVPANDAASARLAVEQGSAAVAVIIPPEATAAVTGAVPKSTITLYEDPTLSIGPAIVKAVAASVLDSLTGSEIAIHVTDQQFAQRGVQANDALEHQIMQRYVAWAQAQGNQQQQGQYTGLTIQAPPTKAATANQGSTMLALLMAGMMIFFAFFTGASCAESIIREDEEGTLARLATTPTPSGVILGGKLVAVVLTVAVQVIVLLAVGVPIFGIRWGQPPAVAVVALGTVAAAAGFGVFLMSLVRTTRQSGPVLGGVLTLMGMIGGLFTVGIPNVPAFFETINLLTPHGWALRGMKMVLSGAGVSEVGLPALIMLLMGAGFFAIGVMAFRKRFA